MAKTIDLTEKLREGYIDYVLTQGRDPESVYSFCKDLKLKEMDFYSHYSSFAALKADLWHQYFEVTKQKIEAQEVWPKYNLREKVLSFFFTLLEILKPNRSFVAHCVKHTKPGTGTPEFLKKTKQSFLNYFGPIVKTSLENGELAKRRFVSDLYADTLWAQFLVITRFWVHDSSDGFEKTDEAIEKGVNLTIDLMARSPLDSLIDYGKFIARNSNFRA
jgi:AcrR family transcriptional regulator